MTQCRKVPECCTACTLYELPYNYMYNKYNEQQIKNHIKKRKTAGFKLIQAFVAKSNKNPYYSQSEVYKYLLSLGFKDVSDMPYNGRHSETDVRLLVFKLANYKEDK